MHKLWVYPSSHEERPIKYNGTHEGHGSQHRPTKNPPLGVERDASPLVFAKSFLGYGKELLKQDSSHKKIMLHLYRSMRSIAKKVHNIFTISYSIFIKSQHILTF